MQRPSEAPQTPPPTARLLVNVYNLSGEKLITFSQNVSLEGKDKWEELSIGLTAKEAVQVEISCENASNISVFFDDLSVKVQAVPTVLVVQENHYYPFGLGMKGLDWVLPNGKEDKYSFQGKEKQTDFDLNLSDFEARDFDYQIDRTTTIDPHAENYYSLSPYSFLGNNPLRFIDPTGMDIVDGRDVFEKFQKDVDEHINNTEVSIKNKEAKLKIANDKKPRTAFGRFFNNIHKSSMKSSISRLKSNLQEYRNTKIELTALDESDQKYSIYLNSSAVPSGVGAEGQGAAGVVLYDNSNDVVQVHLKNGYNSAFLAHELKHAFQFEMGQISFLNGVTRGGNLYDWQDEVEAFNRGYVFGDSRKPSNVQNDYKNLYTSRPNARNFYGSSGQITGFGNVMIDVNNTNLSNGQQPLHYFRRWKNFIKR